MLPILTQKAQQSLNYTYNDNPYWLKKAMEQGHDLANIWEECKGLTDFIMKILLFPLKIQVLMQSPAGADYMNLLPSIYIYPRGLLE